MTVAEARAEARAQFARIQFGADPAAERLAGKAWEATLASTSTSGATSCS